MAQMTHRERVMAATKKQDVDRVPYCFWCHLPHKDQDAIAIAEEMVDRAVRWDLDFVKLAPYGNYSATDYGLSCDYFCTEDKPVKERKFRELTPAEWASLPVFEATYATYGKTLQIAIETKKELERRGLDLPVVQTIFTPLTTAAKLRGPAVWEDLKTCPDEVKAGLEAIANTMINFVNANIDAGVDGFFYASQACRERHLTREGHAEFAEPYDLMVANAYNGRTWLNMVHIHGNDTYFDIMANYPCEVVNWHDRRAGPSMEEARKISDKCFLGGVNEGGTGIEPVLGNKDVTPEMLKEHVREVFRAAGTRGLIVGPGCNAPWWTPDEHYAAIKEVCEEI